MIRKRVSAAPNKALPVFWLGLALALLAAGCGTAAAQVGAGSNSSQIPDVLAAPDLTESTATGTETTETDELVTVERLVDDVLILLGETGYYGECPTIEALGLDPLSSSTPDKLAEETQTQHCSWTIAEHPEGLTLNLDRLDVFGDEALYYLAFVSEGDGWRLAETAERSAMGSELISAEAVYIDDLLPT